ncbi:acyltransferase [Arthrobacter bambusae]|nr:acyltransferase [Arthrobacter bambusae]
MNVKKAIQRRIRYAAEVTFNWVGTYVPSHFVRQHWMETAGSSIGLGSSIFMGTKIFGADKLRIGADTSIGFRCVLDSRGGLTVGDRVVVASDVQIITGSHDVHSDGFDAVFLPVDIGNSAWIASRATILQGSRIGEGAVVAAASLVRQDVRPREIVAGVPARRVGERSSSLKYNPRYRPAFY